MLSRGRGAGPPGIRLLRALMTQCNVLTYHTWNAEQLRELINQPDLNPQDPGTDLGP